MAVAAASNEATEKGASDLEKNAVVQPIDIDSGATSIVPATETPAVHRIRTSNAFFRTLNSWETWLDAKLGIETQGIDRIPEEEKTPPSLWNSFFLWWSFICHAGSLPVGMIGPLVGLDLGQSLSAIIVGTFLGVLCTAWCALLGPKLGLRAVATSRYSFGFWGSKLCSILNIVIAGGFGVVNFVTVGQILSAVSDYTMSVAVGCVIVGVLSYLVSFFGFRLIHTFEKYSWIASFVLICVLLGQAGPHIGAAAPGFNSGATLAGSWLSFMAICFSSGSAWCSIAADYYCHYSSHTKGWLLFCSTLFGLSLGTIFVYSVGACIGNAALIAAYEPYATANAEHGIGGLIRTIYHPLGWSKFAMVLLLFSVLGNNIAVFYSCGLSLQLLGDYCHALPRFIWSFLTAVVVTVLAIAGREHLSTIISNFVSLLGYWTISFTLILLLEDQWFRRHRGYNLEVWDQPRALPWGAAAVISLLAGYLGGGLPGMAQLWWVGPVAAKIGDYGGDVGIYLSGAITLLVYPPLRYLELKHTGR